MKEAFTFTPVRVLRSDVALLPIEAQERFRQYELAGLITITDPEATSDAGKH